MICFIRRGTLNSRRAKRFRRGLSSSGRASEAADVAAFYAAQEYAFADLRARMQARPRRKL